jgi:hypothetical protein
MEAIHVGLSIDDLMVEALTTAASVQIIPDSSFFSL